MIVVSDASPLIALLGIDQLGLLPALYQRVAVPTSVWTEVERGATVDQQRVLAAASWIERRTVAGSQVVVVLQDTLDLGEAEAIALAVDLEADFLLMDERLGRQTAKNLGLRVVGVLVEAKHKRLLDGIGPLIERLRDDLGFRLAPALVQRVLADVGESSIG